MSSKEDEGPRLLCQLCGEPIVDEEHVLCEQAACLLKGRAAGAEFEHC